ncbi:MAG: ABC transporter permease [Spirochaetota bacterium]
MNKLWKVVKQEFKMTAANKAFVIITIIGPILIFAVSVLPGLLSMNLGIPPDTRIAFIGGDEGIFRELANILEPRNIILARGKDFALLKQEVLKGNYQGILRLPDNYINASSFQYFSKTGTDIVVSQTLEGTLGYLIFSKRLAQEGIDPGKIASLSVRPKLETEKLSASGVSEKQDFGTIIMTAIGFIMLIYMTVLLYGQLIGRSVVMEKTSKTVEILLSSVKPLDILFGKILGKGLAGLLQYAFWVGMAMVLIKIIGPALNTRLPAGLNLGSLGFLVLFFILAFFLYSSAYAALGAGAEDEQHLGQLAWPLIMFLVIPLMMISPIVMNPGSPLVLFLSYFPLTSPLVMFIRILVDIPSLGEIGLCVAVLIVSIAGMVYLSAKIFRIGILMTGKRFKLGEIVKWVRH